MKNPSLFLLRGQGNIPQSLRPLFVKLYRNLAFYQRLGKSLFLLHLPQSLGQPLPSSLLLRFQLAWILLLLFLRDASIIGPSQLELKCCGRVKTVSREGFSNSEKRKRIGG